MSLSRVWLVCETSWTIQSMEFSIQNAGVGSLFLLQGIFPIQGLNLGLPHCRQILYLLSYLGSLQIRSDQSLSRVRLFVTPWIAAHQASLSITNSRSSPKTLKSLLQHHSSEASVLQLSAFCMVQLSHPYMTSGKTIALTIWTFVEKV